MQKNEDFLIDHKFVHSQFPAGNILIKCILKTRRRLKDLFDNFIKSNIFQINNIFQIYHCFYSFIETGRKTTDKKPKLFKNYF